MLARALALLMLADGLGPAIAVEPQVATAFPSPAELEVDRIGKAMLAEGIPPREDHCVDANLAASDLELPLLMPSATISLRENTCIDAVGVDSRNRITFFGTKR